MNFAGEFKTKITSLSSIFRKDAFYSCVRWVRLLFHICYFVMSLFHLCKLLSEVGWEVKVIWAEPQTSFQFSLIGRGTKLLHLELPSVCLILPLLHWEEQKGNDSNRDASPAEILGVVYFLLESNLFFILLKSQNVMAEKKCALFSIWLKH